MGPQIVRHNWATNTHTHTHTHTLTHPSLDGHLNRRRKWQPTSVLLSGKSHGWRSLVSYSPWGCKESGTTEWLNSFTSLLLGNSNLYHLYKWYKYLSGVTSNPSDSSFLLPSHVDWRKWEKEIDWIIQLYRKMRWQVHRRENRITSIKKGIN